MLPLRTTRLSPVLCTALLACCVSATALAQRPTVDERQFAADVAALCAPEMAGRSAGSRGGERAILWLRRRFRELGLEPLDGAADLRQSFAVSDPRPARFESAGTGLRAVGGEERTFALGDDFVPFGFSAAGRAEGELVFAGYGLRIAELGHDDFRGLDCEGRIVVLLRGAPRWRDPDSPYRAQGKSLLFSAKIGHAVAAGAVGVLLVDADGGSGGEHLEIAARARGEAAVPAAWLSPAAARALLARIGVDLEVRRARLDRDPTDRRALAASLGQRAELCVAFAWRPESLRTANVVGVVPAVDGAGPQQRAAVVIGAHHDHVGRGEFGSLDPDGAGRVHPGADDNASGVAALLWIAERVAADPLHRPVVFAAFGAEELGALGSRSLLSSGLLPADRVHVMLNLDTIGRATPGRLQVDGVGCAVGLAEAVQDCARELGLQPRLRESAPTRSDHRCFQAAGIPALHFHSGLHEHLHRPSDTPQLVLVPEAVRVAQLAADVARRLARREDERSAGAGR